MASAAAEVFIKIGADTKGLTSGIDSATKAVQGLGDNVSKASGTYVDANGRMRDANGKFTGSARQASEAAGAMAESLAGAGKKASIFGEVFKGTFVGTLAADAASKVIGFFSGQLTGAVASLLEVEKANAQTVSVIKSTGGAAGVSAQHVMDYANSLERTTGIAAENIQRGQNLLLTFTNIRNGVGATNQIFDQATDIMVDLSAAMGGDAKGAAIQLGKALNDPTAGISALTRVGVSFTDAQKAQIEAMQKSGNIMGAQKVILEELKKEFGGSAEAAGKTLPGALNRLNNGIQAVIKNMMSPATGILTNGIIMVADASFKLSDVLMGPAGVAASLHKAFGPTAIAAIVGVGTVATYAALPAIMALIPALAGVALGFIPVALAAAKFTVVAAGIAALAYPIVNNWETIKGAMSGIVNDATKKWVWFANGVSELASGIYRRVVEAFGKIGGYIRRVIGDDLADELKIGLGSMQAGISDFKAFTAQGFEEAAGFVKKHWGGAADDLKATWNKLTTVTKVDLSKLSKRAQDTGAAVAEVGNKAADAGKKAAKGAKEATAAQEALAKATQKGFEKFELMARALEGLSARLREVDAQAAAQGRSFDVAGARAKAYKDSIGQIESAFGKVSAQADAARAELNRYAEASRNGGAATAEAYGTIDNASKALEIQGRIAAALGSEYDALAEAVKSAEGALTKLIEQGLMPGNAAYDEAAAKLVKIRAEQEAAAAATINVGETVKAFASEVGNLGSSLGTLFDTFGLKGLKPIAQMLQTIGTTITAVTTLGSAISALSSGGIVFNLLTAGLGVMTAAATILKGVFIGLGVAIMATPIGWIAAGVAAVALAIAGLALNWEKISGIFSGAFDWIGGKISWLWGTVTGEAEEATRKATEAAAKAQRAIEDSLAGSFRQAGKDFVNNVEDWGDKLRSSLRNNVINGIFDALISGEMMQNLAALKQAVLDNAGDPLSEAFRDAVKALGDGMTAEIKRLEPAFEAVRSLVNEVLPEAAKKVEEKTKAVSAAASKSGDSANKGAIATLLATQKTYTTELTRLSNMAGGRESAEYQRILARANEISGWIRNLNEGRPIPATFADSTMRSLAVLPELATGGLVKSPTVALVGEGRDQEAVLPLNESVYRQIGQGIASAHGGNGAGYTVHVHYTGSGKWTREDAQGLGRMLVSELRTMGVRA